MISTMSERVGVKVGWIGIAYPYSLYLYICFQVSGSETAEGVEAE